MSRKGEQETKHHYRSDRVVAINGEWFFMTREGIKPVGPFPTREKAELALKGYVEDMQSNRSRFEAESHMRMIKDAFRDDRF